jgi:hypothetical protein
MRDCLNVYSPMATVGSAAAVALHSVLYLQEIRIYQTLYVNYLCADVITRAVESLYGSSDSDTDCSIFKTPTP